MLRDLVLVGLIKIPADTETVALVHVGSVIATRSDPPEAPALTPRNLALCGHAHGIDDTGTIGRNARSISAVAPTIASV